MREKAGALCHQRLAEKGKAFPHQSRRVAPRQLPPGEAFLCRKSCKKQQFCFVLQSLSHAFRMTAADCQASATLFLEKNFGRCFPAEAFSRAIIDQIDNHIHKVLCNCMEVKTLREKEPENAVGVFVRTSLPRLVRLCEVNNRLQLVFQGTKL